MTDFGLSATRGRRTLWERAHDVRITPLEIAIYIGGAVLVGLIGAASGAGLTF